MKNILLLVVCALIANTSFAQIFKETQRTTTKGAPIAYADTMAIFSWTKDSVTFNYKGFKYSAPIEKNDIKFYYANFKIDKNTPEEIILSEKDIKHIFTPHTVKQTTVTSVNALPTQPIASINETLLKGNWEAYRRANRNGPSNTIEANQTVKVVSFDTVSPLQGQMKAFKQAQTALYTIVGIEGSYLLAKDAQQKDIKLPVFELDARNFVFEDPNGILYYCRKVK